MLRGIGVPWQRGKVLVVEHAGLLDHELAERGTLVRSHGIVPGVIGGIGLITDQIIRTLSAILFRWREANS